MPMPQKAPCAGCGTTEAVAYLATNAGELEHAEHGLLCVVCWRAWMHGRRWAGKRSTSDLEAVWEEADGQVLEAPAKPAAKPKAKATKPRAVDLFGKATVGKPRRRRR